MAKPKYSPEHKIKVATAYLAGEGSFKSLAKKYGVNRHAVYSWSKKYQEFGEAGFIPRIGNAKYTAEFKMKCVAAVIRGDGSIDEKDGRERLKTQFQCVQAE